MLIRSPNDNFISPRNIKSGNLIYCPFLDTFVNRKFCFVGIQIRPLGSAQRNLNKSFLVTSITQSSMSSPCSSTISTLPFLSTLHSPMNPQIQSPTIFTTPTKPILTRNELDVLQASSNNNGNTNQQFFYGTTKQQNCDLIKIKQQPEDDEDCGDSGYGTSVVGSSTSMCNNIISNTGNNENGGSVRLMNDVKLSNHSYTISPNLNINIKKDVGEDCIGPLGIIGNDSCVVGGETVEENDGGVDGSRSFIDNMFGRCSPSINWFSNGKTCIFLLIYYSFLLFYVFTFLLLGISSIFILINHHLSLFFVFFLSTLLL